MLEFRRAGLDWSYAAAPQYMVACEFRKVKADTLYDTGKRRISNKPDSSVHPQDAFNRQILLSDNFIREKSMTKEELISRVQTT